jgi:hypothetical protein
MPVGVVPKSEDGLSDYAQNFTTLISAAPSDYGLTAAQSASAVAAYNLFVAKLAVCKSPTTKTAVAVVEKTEAADALRKVLSSLGGMVSANSDVSNALKTGLRIGIRGSHGSPIPAPNFYGTIVPKRIQGNSVAIQIIGPDKRASRPAGVACATILAYVGETPSPNPADWKTIAVTGKMRLELTFADAPPGAKVWLTMYYSSPRFASGPGSPPLSVNLQLGNVPVGL